MLFRALSGVEKGFYVDVGAQDPVTDSVTKLFYTNGWRGINIEPVADWFEKIQMDRPDDINLQVAAYSTNGDIAFYEVVGTGLSTIDKGLSEHYAEQGHGIREYRIAGNTLDTILSRHGIKEVHFLKIDAEGAEKEVLRGIDLKMIRPWIILVEACEPLSSVPSYQEWEDLLTRRAYDFVYFDGLNRFYLAREHQSRRNAFSSPPYYSDDFIRYREWSSRQYAYRLEAELAEIRQNERLTRAELRQVYASRSWRITKPLRVINAGLLGSAARVPETGRRARLLSPRRAVEGVLRAIIGYFLKRPGFMKCAAPVLRLLPGLDSRIRRFARSGEMTSAGASMHTNGTTSPPPVALTPRARRIFDDLKAVFAARPDRDY